MLITSTDPSCANCLQDMRLALYRDGQLVLDFIAYLVARGVSAGVLAQHMGAAKKVLMFCDTLALWPHTGDLFMCYSRWVAGHGGTWALCI